MISVHPWEKIAHSVGDFPASWPVLLFPLLLGLVSAGSRSPRLAGSLARVRGKIVVGTSVVCLGLFVFCVGTYLGSVSFRDFYESREASVAALIVRGEAAYPGDATQERYAAPYGPALYLALGLSQRVLGPSVFSSKLPGAIAALLAVMLFWVIVRRESGSNAVAFAVAGLEAALLLAFRFLTFWAKSDPLILLAVTAGLLASLSEGWIGAGLLGVCIGAAVDLKPHAAAYFLPTLVIAWRSGWRWRELSFCGAVAALTAAAPFVFARQEFSLANYVAFLRVTAQEGVGRSETLGFVRWTLLLWLILYVSDRVTSQQGGSGSDDPGNRRALRGSLGLAILLVAFPACAVGAGQTHLMPLIPAVLLAAGMGLKRGSFARWQPNAPLLARVAAYTGVVACALVSVQTTLQLAEFHRSSEITSRACQKEIRSLLAKYSHLTVLTGFGGDGEGDMFPTSFRQEAVFAGHPVGMDVAAMMDSQRGGQPEPNLSRFIRELRERRQRDVLWLLPRGSTPFSRTNLYDPTQTVNSDAFRRDFLAQFELREHAEFYDVYVSRDNPL